MFTICKIKYLLTGFLRAIDIARIPEDEITRIKQAVSLTRLAKDRGANSGCKCTTQ